MDIFIGGIGNSFVVHMVLHAGAIEQIGNLLGYAGAGYAFVRDDERFIAA